jgi:hypothetical protein
MHDIAHVNYSLQTESEETKAQIIDLPMETSLSIEAMERSYTRGKESLRKRYDEFLRYWREEGIGLLDLQAFLTAKPVEGEGELLSRFISENRGGTGAERVSGDSESPSEAPVFYLYTIWTIGERLEQEVKRRFDSDDPMQAILLDVAGSRIVLNIHTAVQRWIRAAAARPNGLNIIGEVYPGTHQRNGAELEELVRFAGAGNAVGATQEGSMFVPKKTMHSLFLIGEGRECILEKIQPCFDCSGRKCLYYQLGGCHGQDAL